MNLLDLDTLFEDEHNDVYEYEKYVLHPYTVGSKT